MIRPMTVKDITHVQQIVHETWEKTYDGIIPKEHQKHFLDRTYSEMMLMKRMEKTTMLITEHEGQPIGFANLTFADADGDSELTALYILPTYQQVGYGKQLFQSILSQLANAKQLSIYVDEQNTIGQNFFKKEGCQFVEVFDEFFENHPVKTIHYVYLFPTESIS